MNEYEFRLVVQHARPLTHVLRALGRPIHTQRVTYAKPHFRYKRRVLETKMVYATQAVYFESLWFRWVHSVEVPFRLWSVTTHAKFVHTIQNFACPFWTETRQHVQLDDRAQVYTFRHRDGLYRLVFEWEYGTFEQPLETVPTDALLAHLGRYRHVFRPFSAYDPPPYKLNESLLVRKPVTYLAPLDAAAADSVVAHKLDGVFGFVSSYADRIECKWEDETQQVVAGVTLGDGIVFAAEKLDDARVLLDVYQVRGHATTPWCRRSILRHFLPGLTLPDGFRIQEYRETVHQLPDPSLKTDGYIGHNTVTDHIVKMKRSHSLDVVYMDGYFVLPSQDGRTKRQFVCLDRGGMVNGHVYEVSIDTGRVMRRRTDRWTGNTWQQIENILTGERVWKGPPIHEVIKVRRLKQHRNKKR